MKSIKLIIGGNYFTADKVKFFDNPVYYQVKDRLDRDTIDWDRVRSRARVPFGSEAAVVFGLKTWTRRARKHFRSTPKEIIEEMHRFVKKTIGKAPLGVVDDLAIDEQKQFGDQVRQMFFDNFDCRFYLIREGLSTKRYDSRVHSFTMPCLDNTYLVKPTVEKSIDVFFRGNSSASQRIESFHAIRNMQGAKTDIFMYDGGDHAPERLSFDDFLKRMADSKFCLHFMGTGYCCYRYQEIASTGSIIVSPKYPHIISNDYQDMESCVVYNTVEEMKLKINELLKSPDRVQSMQDNSIRKFKQFHTTEKRFEQFMSFVDDLGK